MGFDGSELKKQKQKQKQSTKKTHPADTFDDTGKGKTTIIDLLTWVAIAFLVTMLVFFAYRYYVKPFPLFTPAVEKKAKTPTAKKSKTAKEKALEQVSATYTWGKGGTGHILELDLHIINNFVYQVKDLTIFCSYAGPSGTTIGTKTKKLYEAIPPNVDMNFGTISMGFVDSQTQNVRCDIMDLTVDFSKSIRD